ncbi:ATP-binding protein [Maridesulfovibrio hydrothermalis]|uniref:histidine kinase n=1 Tax=Maridesulfovibrio hydrothermalis AM13 = DSM 14728 TaxID=1121451 RepID=L0RFV3_9BACT|nr:ATP-binding protein [Maridesulfovibrio hydrothermalis]CCO25117.1 PAS/PAC sensor signal transduction histidine kinase [Maridesulfovibrio hydrothermalis AM13 = DSM 14728]
MNLLSRLRFRTKINLGLTVIVGFTSLIIAIFVIRMASDALIEQSRKRGAVLAGNLAMRAEDPLLSIDLLRLESMVNELKKADDEIVYAFIMDDRKRVLANTFSDGFPVQLKDVNDVAGTAITAVTVDTGKTRIFDFAAPIFISDKKLGTVRVGLSRAGIQSIVQNLIFAISALTGAVLLLAVVASTQFAKRITFRLGSLQKHAEDIVATHLGPGLSKEEKPKSCAQRFLGFIRDNAKGDEIQELTQTFDAMAMSLECHIEDLQITENDLTRQKELLKTIINVSPDFVSLLGPQMTYLAVNKTFAEHIGRSEEEILGLTDDDIYPPETARLRKEETRQVISTGRVINKETREASEDDNTVRWFHTIRVPVYAKNHKIIGVLSTAREITELKSYQAQLIQSQKMESVGKLAGGVAHEINTPLGIILGYAQLLQDDFDPEDQVSKDLGIIEKQARVCRKIVADLLGFSRQTESEKISMCFNNSILEVVQLVSHTFKLEQLDISTNLDDRYPIIHGDPEKLKQVWLNLLSNAMESIEGKGGIHISTKLDISSMTITAVFADTGHGVEPKNINAIFDPFYSTKPVGKGTGLGLSVSFGIIKDHGGSIEALSPLPRTAIREYNLPENSGPGTMFKVVLPLDEISSDEEGSVKSG